MASQGFTEGNNASGSGGESSLQSDFFDVKDFEEMNAQMQTEDEKREDVIKRSREVLKASKTAIYCLHRLELQKAESHMDKAEKVARELLPITEEHPHLRFGILTSSLEEWAEAKVFHYFLVHGKIPTRKQLEIVNVEEFLGGVMDFTGELNRYAILRATNREVSEIKKCREFVDQLMAQLMQFEFRNGQLRKKYDGIKYTLKKMETLIYELSLTNSGETVRPKSTAEEGDEENDQNGDEREDSKRARYS